MQIVDILKAAQQQNSSDIHIAPGNPVMLRIDGMLVPQRRHGELEKQFPDRLGA